MSVLLETSAGDIVIDLLVDYAPKLCENFLKLCKIKYYNFAPIHSIQKDFSFQTGDPLGPLSRDSDGGTSIWGLLSDDPAKKTFTAQFHPKLKHVERGTVGMATAPHISDPDVRLAGSQFIVTLADDTDYLDGKSAIFGKVVEGFDALEKINVAVVDTDGHPLVDIRIKHCIILDDPFPDPDGMPTQQPQSPLPSKAQLATVRIADDAELNADDGADPEDLERRRREREARHQALTLEMMGDLPFAEVKPPENVLFVCKLNPVTKDEDLELIFSRFGKILSCEIIRDQKTMDSLQYAFIEFEEKEQCEAAYFKMQDVLIDDRRIHVDFSQSVSKLSDAWRSDTNQKRAARSKGGWGGVEELEKWRKYRDEGEENERERKKGVYGMVHSVDDMEKRRDASERDDERRRSRSPRARGKGHSRRGENETERTRRTFDENSRPDRDTRDYRRDRRSDQHGRHRDSGRVSDQNGRDRLSRGERCEDRSRYRDNDRSRRNDAAHRHDHDRNRDRDRDRHRSPARYRQR